MVGVILLSLLSPKTQPALGGVFFLLVVAVLLLLLPLDGVLVFGHHHLQFSGILSTQVRLR